MKTLALAELVFDLPCALFGLLKAAHGFRPLTVTEVNVAQVKVCPVEILQQMTLSFTGSEKAELTVSYVNLL